MPAEAPEDLPDVIVGITFHLQTAQTDGAETVLQFAADLREEVRRGGQRKIVSAETKQREPRAFHVREGGIDLLALGVVERAYPAAGRIEVLAVPGRTALDRSPHHYAFSCLR